MKQSNIPNEAACGSESNANVHSQAHAYAGVKRQITRK